uniref:Uncharacterized protein n=1 Tax=Solanum lycopersicum TaxID=4081 RepID=A0A3Q7GT67_SOLLC
MRLLSAHRPAVGAYGPQGHMSLAKSSRRKRHGDCLEVQFPSTGGHVRCKGANGSAYATRLRPSSICQGLRRTGVDSKIRPWTALTVERLREWHAITPVDSTHGRTMSDLSAITALGQHTGSDNGGLGMTSLP